MQAHFDPEVLLKVRFSDMIDDLSIDSDILCKNLQLSISQVGQYLRSALLKKSLARSEAARAYEALTEGFTVLGQLDLVPEPRRHILGVPIPIDFARAGALIMIVVICDLHV